MYVNAGTQAKRGVYVHVVSHLFTFSEDAFVISWEASLPPLITWCQLVCLEVRNAWWRERKSEGETETAEAVTTWTDGSNVGGVGVEEEEEEEDEEDGEEEENEAGEERFVLLPV